MSMRGNGRDKELLPVLATAVEGAVDGFTGAIASTSILLPRHPY